MISKSIEDAYKDFVMQHKFPFVVLHFSVNGDEVDVNVHPTKMELRFQKQQEVYGTVFEGVHRTLLEPELISPGGNPGGGRAGVHPRKNRGESFRKKPRWTFLEKQLPRRAPFCCAPRADRCGRLTMPFQTARRLSWMRSILSRKMRERVTAYHQQASSAEIAGKEDILRREVQEKRIAKAAKQAKGHKRKHRHLPRW